MSRLNWRLAVLPDLARPAAPRVLTTTMLCDMIAVHRPHIAKATMLSVLSDLVSIAAVQQISSELFLNQRCNPPAVLAEAASHIRKDAAVSLQSALYEAGVIQDSSNKITAVLPDTHLEVWDKELIFIGSDSFEFHVLPAEYFPPTLLDQGDVIAIEQPFLCFTPEKSLLDWLFLQKSSNAELPQLAWFDLTKLNMLRLDELAKRMRLRYLLERFLRQPVALVPEVDTTQLNSAAFNNDPNITRIPRVLNSLRKIWEMNPELKLSQILTTVGQKESVRSLLEMQDSDWESGFAALAMLDNTDNGNLGQG